MNSLPGLRVIFLMLWAAAQIQSAEPKPSDQAVLSKEAGALLAGKKYEALDRMAETLRLSKEQFVEGTPKLPSFYEGLREPEAKADGKITEEERAAFLAQLDAWIGARPQSGPAKLARAYALLAAAMYNRATGRLSAEANLWNHYLLLAKKQLADSETALARDPEYFRARLILGLRLGGVLADYEKLYKSAVALDPDYCEFYVLNALWKADLPQPRAQTWEEFAEEVAHATEAKFGMEFYARIVWAFKPSKGIKIFDQTRASWPMVKQGFVDLEKRAPDSTWNLNAFCWHACAARDRETAASLFARLGEHWSKQMWSTQEFFEAQQKWAQSTDAGDEERDPVGPRARDRLARSDFDGLEKTAVRLQTEKTRNVEGNWVLPSFYVWLELPRLPNPTDKEWQAHFARLEEWQAKFPNSAVPRIALGHAWAKYAWVGRGAGYADKIKTDGWKLMSERLAKARTVLESARNLPGKDVGWFGAMQTVALGEGWPREEYERLFEEAVQFEPAYTPFYTAKAYFLLPRWYGAPGETERFAAEIFERAKRPEIYARIVLANSALADSDPFAAGGFSWPKTSAGFEAILAAYPNRWNLINYCWLACKAHERDAARALFEKVGEPAPTRPWKSRADFDFWKAWASGGPEPK